ncbi:hypothetical protein D9M68_533410 [compost metagenome]
MKFNLTTITPEQYHSLASTSSWVELRQMTKAVFNRSFAAIATLRRFFKRKKNVSCLRAKPAIASTVYPMEYNKNNPMSGFNEAALNWSATEQDKLRDFYSADNYMERCEQIKEMVKDEIAMEELYASGLEVLIKK